MKRKELVACLMNYGWWSLRQGSNHEIWTNGEHQLAIPRHREINEFTAKAIIKVAEKNRMRLK